MRAPPPGSPAIIPDYCRPLPTIIRQERTRRRTWPALTRTRLLRPGHRRLKSRLVLLLRSAASGPPAGGGWQARGRFGMQKWAQVAEESGSRVWARPRAACHLTPSQWRARHTGATPHSASRNRRTSPRAKSRRWGYHHSPAGRHKSADEMALPSALQSGSTRHEARSGWSIQTAAGVCAVGEATCDGRWR